MRQILLLVLLIIAATGIPTVGVCNGLVTIRADSLSADCYALDNTVGLRTIYLVHVVGGGVISGMRFRLEAGPGVTWTYVSEVHYAPTLAGDTQSGVTFCYGTCEGNYMPLAKVTYMAYGTSDECAQIRVVPHPDSNTIEELLCGGSVVGARGGVFFLGAACGEPVCPDTYYGSPGTPFDFCQPIGTALTTWGAIKSLYR